MMFKLFIFSKNTIKLVTYTKMHLTLLCACAQWPLIIFLIDLHVHFSIILLMGVSPCEKIIDAHEKKYNQTFHTKS